MDCEGCTSITVKEIPSDVVDFLLEKQIKMRKELKWKPNLSQVVIKILKEVSENK